MQCCDDPKFELVEDLGHVESVDWDLAHRSYKLTSEESKRFRDRRFAHA